MSSRTRPEYIIKCWGCHAFICFDSEHVSENGKKIPLNLLTREPHQCPQKPKIFCKHCGIEITFDDYHLSSNGRRVPVTKKSGGVHRCKARPFNRETRRAWWYEQQEKAEEQRERYQHEQNQRSAYYEDLSWSEQNRKYREILGISDLINPTEDEIRNAYRQKCLAYHPDRCYINGLSEAEANEKMKLLNEAYERVNIKGYYH